MVGTRVSSSRDRGRLVCRSGWGRRRTAPRAARHLLRMRSKANKPCYGRLGRTAKPIPDFVGTHRHTLMPTPGMNLAPRRHRRNGTHDHPKNGDIGQRSPTIGSRGTARARRRTVLPRRTTALAGGAAVLPERAATVPSCGTALLRCTTTLGGRAAGKARWFALPACRASATACRATAWRPRVAERGAGMSRRAAAAVPGRTACRILAARRGRWVRRSRRRPLAGYRITVTRWEGLPVGHA
jgi:hypothetical protein